MPIPFEPTRSYVYRAARYELLPRIAEIARNRGDEPFLLREISKRVLDETYTPEQLEIRIKKAKSDVTEKMRNIFGFYIPFLADNLRVFENLGGGQFKNISIDEELAEADAVATNVESNDSGKVQFYGSEATVTHLGQVRTTLKILPAPNALRRFLGAIGIHNYDAELIALWKIQASLQLLKDNRRPRSIYKKLRWRFQLGRTLLLTFKALVQEGCIICGLVPG